MSCRSVQLLLQLWTKNHPIILIGVRLGHAKGPSHQIVLLGGHGCRGILLTRTQNIKVLSAGASAIHSGPAHVSVGFDTDRSRTQEATYSGRH